MRKYVLPFLCLLLLNCTGIKPIEVHETTTAMDNLALTHFGEKYATKDNKTGSHVIVFKKYKELEDLFATVKYFIFEKSSQSLLYQDELKGGSVAWHSEFKIIATSRTMKAELTENQESTSIYYYDVKQRKKVEH